MKPGNLTAVAIFCLAVSIVVGSWLISSSLVASAAHEGQAANLQTKQLLTERQLAKYLGISFAQAVQIGPLPDANGNTQSVLPYIQIGKSIYFPRTAVDEWLQNR